MISLLPATRHHAILVTTNEVPRGSRVKYVWTLAHLAAPRSCETRCDIAACLLVDIEGNEVPGSWLKLPEGMDFYIQYEQNAIVDSHEVILSEDPTAADDCDRADAVRYGWNPIR